MTKTPFEIRADLLKLAADHLEKQFVANVSFVTEYNKALLDSGVLGERSTLPKYFTTDEVIKKAAEFYNFVQTR
jgi:hypothetical protein